MTVFILKVSDDIVIVTEDKGSRRIYKSWVPQVNPGITYVESIFDVTNNNFTIISGYGYPQYFSIIEGVIQDINDRGNIDRLVIAVDSEEKSYLDKLKEITARIDANSCTARVIPLIQHFCIETWGLGNRRICPANPNQPRLRDFKAVFDVRTRDPELLPGYPRFKLNRAQFAEAYLNACLHCIGSHLSYNKANPKPLCTPGYFREVRLRCVDYGHIKSFTHFLTAFV